MNSFKLNRKTKYELGANYYNRNIQLKVQNTEENEQNNVQLIASNYLKYQVRTLSIAVACSSKKL